MAARPRHSSRSRSLSLIEVSAKAASIRVRLRLHVEEIKLVAIAFDSAMTGGDGELYYRPKDART